MKTFLKILLISSGILSLLLGILGVFLPLLPTTPFLLLSAYCFSKSSDTFHKWLLGNRYFGKIIDDYHKGQGVPKRIKIYALLFMWLSILSTSIFVISILWLRILLIGIAIGVTWHIVRLKSK